MEIRHAQVDDAPGCVSIYAPFVTSTAVSFEQNAPSSEDFAQRIARITETHCFLVADTGNEIAGYAYAGVHRERAAYRWTCEVSVYLDARFRGQSLGRALYEVMFPLLAGQGFRLLLAGITIPNPSSVGLHRALGFEEIGIYRSVGWKAGAWRDVMWLGRELDAHGPEAEPLPPGPPVRLEAPVPVTPRAPRPGH